MGKTESELGSLPLEDASKCRCALVVHMLSKLPQDILVKNKDKICIHFKKDEIYYDHYADIWYWFDRKTLYNSKQLPLVALRISDKLIKQSTHK